LRLCAIRDKGSSFVADLRVRCIRVNVESIARFDSPTESSLTTKRSLDDEAVSSRERTRYLISAESTTAVTRHDVAEGGRGWGGGRGKEEDRI
jgi:hypothetical protein